MCVRRRRRTAAARRPPAGSLPLRCTRPSPRPLPPPNHHRARPPPQVRRPSLDWASVARCDAEALAPRPLAEGLVEWALPQGLTALVVDSAEAVPAALARLQASMTDPLLAIDLEWRHARNGRPGPVALVQIASADTVLLLRTTRMAYRLPPPVRSLLTAPDVDVVGFAWDHADEMKMAATFRRARARARGGRRWAAAAGAGGADGWGGSMKEGRRRPPKPPRPPSWYHQLHLTTFTPSIPQNPRPNP